MHSRPLLIGFVGISGSGKTTIANAVTAALKAIKHDVLVLNEESYCKPLSQPKKGENERCPYDVSSAIDKVNLLHDLKQLKEGKSITCKRSMHSTSAEESKAILLTPAKIVIVEGIFLLQDENIRNLFDKIFFVDTKLDIAMSRRLKRDEKIEHTNSQYLDRYETLVRPDALVVQELKKYADVILKNNMEAESKASISEAYDSILGMEIQNSVHAHGLFVSHKVMDMFPSTGGRLLRSRL